MADTGMAVDPAWLCKNREGQPDLHSPVRAHYYTLGQVANCSNCGRVVVKVASVIYAESFWVRKIRLVEWP